MVRTLYNDAKLKERIVDDRVIERKLLWTDYNGTVIKESISGRRAEIETQKTDYLGA